MKVLVFDCRKVLEINCRKMYVFTCFLHHIEGLQKFVVDNGLDVGFAYDGDADRCLCVDELGNVITGDHILYIYGRYMKDRGKLLTNTVVTTIMSNFGLYKAFDELGIGYAKTAVGDKYVYEYMQQNGCRIGGEQSGHIIFSKYASTGDGILTSLKMMEVMLARKQKLSELFDGLTIYPQVLENVRVADKAEALANPDVQAAIEQVTAELGDTGRILVRESGTEPVIRVMVEAESEDIVCDSLSCPNSALIFVRQLLISLPQLRLHFRGFLPRIYFTQ